MVVAPVAAREEASPQPGDDTATVASAPADSSHHHHHQSQTPITTTSLLQPIEASTEATSDTQSLLSQVLEHDDDDNDTNGNSSSDDDHSLLSLTDSREAPFLWEDPTFYARRRRSPKQPATLPTTTTTTSLTKPSWTTLSVPLKTISTRRSSPGRSTTDQPVPEPQPFAESPTQTIALRDQAPVILNESDEPTDSRSPSVEAACAKEKNQPDHCQQPESHTPTVALQAPTPVAPVISNAGSDAQTNSSTNNDTGSTKTESDNVAKPNDEESCSKNLDENVSAQKVDDVPMKDTSLTEKSLEDEGVDDSIASSEVAITPATRTEPTLEAVTQVTKENVPLNVEVVYAEENQEDSCEQPESQKQAIVLEAPTPVAPLSDQLKHTSLTEGSSEDKDVDDSTTSVHYKVVMVPAIQTEPTLKAVTHETKENVRPGVEAACAEEKQQDNCKQPESHTQTIALEAPTPVIVNGSDEPTKSSHNNDQGSAKAESDNVPQSDDEKPSSKNLDDIVYAKTVEDDQMKYTSLTEGSSVDRDVDDSTASVPSEVIMIPVTQTEPTSEAMRQETKENVPSSVEAACAEKNQEGNCEQPESHTQTEPTSEAVTSEAKENVSSSVEAACAEETQEDNCEQTESHTQTIALEAPTPVSPVISNRSDKTTESSHNNDQRSTKAESDQVPQSDDEKSSSKNLENNVSAKEVEEDHMKYSSITEGSSEDKDLDDSTASVPFEVVMVPATQTEPTSEVVTQETKENVPPSVEATFVGEHEQDNCDQWDCCSNMVKDNMGKQNANGTIKGMFVFE